MKKIFLLLLAPFFLTSVMAQSGRRIKTPPPPLPTETVVVEPSAPQRNYPLATSEELLVLPQSFLNRQLQLIDNGSLRLADYDDKVIVVNLWATWCGPCRMEIPDYEKVRKEYDDRGVEFIALTPENPNTSADRVRKFVRSYNFGWRVGWADRETEALIMNGSNAIPQTLVVAPGGKIVAQWRGSSSQSGNRLRRAIDNALSK